MSTKGSGDLGKASQGDASSEAALLDYRDPHGLVSADLTVKELAETDLHGVAKGAPPPPSRPPTAQVCMRAGVRS